jgi:hypothetical protein
MEELQLSTMKMALPLMIVVLPTLKALLSLLLRMVVVEKYSIE